MTLHSSQEIFSSLYINLRRYLVFIIVASNIIVASYANISNCHTTQQHALKDKYHEDLYLRPLADGKLFAHFQFTSFYRKDIKSLRWENVIEIFPLSMADLVATTDLHKLHFSLTKGNWNYGNAGYPVRSSPPGAQIRAKFSKHNEDPDRSWRRLVNSLAGKFCASLASADMKALVPTKLAFGHHSISPNSTEQFLYSNIPEETFCTENLTPWKKLLPCYSNSGLASLLNAVNLLKSSYSSLAIDLEPKQCVDEDGDLVVDCEQVQLIQSLSIVFNPLLEFEGKQTWSIAKIFGNSILGQCPLASHSQVHVDITDLDNKNKLYPQNYQEQSLKLSSMDVNPRLYATYDIKKLINASTVHFNSGIKQNQLFKKLPLSSRSSIPIFLKTHVAGLGAFDGSIMATISNTLDEQVRVTYMHALPSFLRVYLHTLTIKTRSNQELKPDKVNFVLSKDESPTLIEFSLVLPANSETQVSYEFERAFLRWTEFRPDANKGTLLGPAMISVTSHSCLKHMVMPLCPSLGRIKQFENIDNVTTLELVDFGEESLCIYARPLLIILPTPDFSMPYNVLCLVCTVLATAIGPIHNITTRKPVIKVEKRKMTQATDVSSENSEPEATENDDASKKSKKVE